MEDTEIVLGSRTQTLEDVQKVLDAGGFEPVATEELSDQPAEVAQGELPAETPDGPGADGAGESEGEEGAEEEEEVHTPEKPRKKRPGGLERKLHKRDSEIAELKQKLTSLEERLAGKPAGEPEAAAASEEAPAEAKLQPQLEDFVAELSEDETYESAVAKFTNALLDWRDEDKKRQSREKAVTDREAETKATAEADVAAQANQWNAQLEMAKAAHDDWDEKIGHEYEEPVSNPVMSAAVQNLEDGAELVYWLASNPKEAARIQKLTTLKANPSQVQINRAFALAYRELAKITVADPNEPQTAAPSPAETAEQGTHAARESRATAAPPKVKTAPPTPVGSRGGSARKARIEEYTAQELRDMPDDEYRRLRGM